MLASTHRSDQVLIYFPLSPRCENQLCPTSPPRSPIPGISEPARAAADESLNGLEPRPVLLVVRQPGVTEPVERAGRIAHDDALRYIPVRRVRGQAEVFPGPFARDHSLHSPAHLRPL